jgi:hypothetical protein
MAYNSLQERTELNNIQLARLAALALLACCACNRNPGEPEVPSGPRTGARDSLYTFTTVAHDPKLRGVCYRFDWGDGDTSDWSDWLQSDSPAGASHYWSVGGTFSIAAQAMNDEDGVSAWSGGHKLTVSFAPVTFGGTRSDAGNAVELTTDGCYIVAGFTASYGEGRDDAWLIKVDDAGSARWQHTIGGTGRDRANSIQQTAEPGYIVTGYTDSKGAGGYDLWLVKTGGSGNVMWDTTFGGDGNEWGNSVIQSADGGYVVAGFTGSTGAGGYDAWLVCTDDEGRLVWDRTFGGGQYDVANCVRQTRDGGYIIVGYTASQGAGGDDLWLIKTDSMGQELWNRTFGDVDTDVGNSVQQTSDGGYIIAGSLGFRGATAGDMWLIKTDSLGNRMWDRTFGGSGYDVGNSVQQTLDGGYIVAGNTDSLGAGGGDILLVRADAAGSEVWSRTFGGISYDAGSSVRQTADGGYVVAGLTVSFGLNGDVWLIRTDANGR